MREAANLTGSPLGAAVEGGEQTRIIRIARAMCRSRRLDPDSPVDLSLPERAGLESFLQGVNCLETPTWLLFVGEAKRFLASNANVASNL